MASELQLWPLLLHIDVNSQDMKQAWNTFLTELNDDKSIINNIYNNLNNNIFNFIKLYINSSTN